MSFFLLYVPFLIIFRLRLLLLLPSFLFLFSLSISSLCLIGRENGGGGRGILCFCGGVLRIGTFLVSRKTEKKEKYTTGFFIRMCLFGGGCFYTEPLYAKVIVSTIWQCTEREILLSPFPASQCLCSTSVLLHSHSFCTYSSRIYCTISPPQIQCKRRKRRIRWLGRVA